MKKEPKIVVQKIDDLSQLRHGDRVVIVENGKKLVEGKLVGRPWASKHVQVGPGRQPRSTIAKAQESVIVNDMITLGSVLIGGARRSTSQETKDYKVLDTPRETTVHRIIIK